LRPSLAAAPMDKSRPYDWMNLIVYFGDRLTILKDAEESFSYTAGFA
jgi:hypothetical protein